MMNKNSSWESQLPDLTFLLLDLSLNKRGSQKLLLNFLQSKPLSFRYEEVYEDERGQGNHSKA